MFLSRQKNPRSTFVTHGKIFSSSAAREGHSCWRLAKSLQSLLYGLQCNGHAYHQSCNGQWAGLPGCLSYSPFGHQHKGRLRGLTRGLTIPNHIIPPHTMQCRLYRLFACNTLHQNISHVTIVHHCTTSYDSTRTK